MKEYYHEYSIGEVAKALGISPELVRYYEKIGLVESIKNTINQYRKFDINLIESLGNIVMLRSLDLSLEAIGEVQDTYGTNLSRSEEILRAKAEEHRRNIKKIQRQLAMTEGLEKDLKRIRMQKDEISIVDSPNLVLYGLSETLDTRDLAVRYNRLIHEQSKLPRFTFLLDVNKLAGADPWLEKYTQFAISVEDTKNQAADSRYLHGTQCAYSTFVGKGVEEVEEKYRQMLLWIREHGYTAVDEAIEIGDLNIGDVFLLEIYIPVKPA